MSGMECRILNPNGSRRVLVTKELPGALWLERLRAADCRVEVCQTTAILDKDELLEAIGASCRAAIGQLTETWDEDVFEALSAAGGSAYSNYAVGFNNVDVPAATARRIAVGNTPGVLTETTAQLAVALTFAAARRIVESHEYLAAGEYRAWLPTLFLGELLWRKTLGVIGAGRIGSAYARMMVEGHRMDLVYYDPHGNDDLESYLRDYGRFLEEHGEEPVSVHRAGSLDEVLNKADVVSIHTVLDESTFHLIDGPRLALMKPHAILVNPSRGPLVDERALVEHARAHPDFRAGLDVYENEPDVEPGLLELPNVVTIPHLGSATSWTREGMATLAATNAAAALQGWPAWDDPDIAPFLGSAPPQAAPSIVNARELGLPTVGPQGPARAGRPARRSQ
jgi:hydroxypyruvate reductase 1